MKIDLNTRLRILHNDVWNLKYNTPQHISPLVMYDIKNKLSMAYNVLSYAIIDLYIVLR